jgi:hypothetical protein
MTADRLVPTWRVNEGAQRMGATTDGAESSVAGGTRRCWQDRPRHPATADGDRLQETTSRWTCWAFETGGLLAAETVQRGLRCPWTLLVMESGASILPLSVPTLRVGPTWTSRLPVALRRVVLGLAGVGTFQPWSCCSTTTVGQSVQTLGEASGTSPGRLRGIGWCSSECAGRCVMSYLLVDPRLCWRGVSVRWWGSVGWRAVGGDRRSRSPTR